MNDVLQRNMADFRAEWAVLAGTGSELRGMTLAFFSPYDAINTAAKTILTAHGAVCSPDAGLRIFLDTPVDTISAMAGSNDRILSFSSTTNETISPYAMQVLIPPLYGAGLADGCGINADLLNNAELPALHIVDFFAVIICALANYVPGVFCASETFLHPARQAISKQEALHTLRLLRDFPDRRFYDDTTYNGNLHKLQQLQLECLVELDRICRENGIDYFLGGGTLLGAVRHGGFIPWDDDIDVMMTRENFDRLAKIAPSTVGKGFFYQNSTTDPYYHSPFAKLRRTGTLFVTEFSSRFPQMHNEVFIDIFAHDAAPNVKALLKPHIFLTKFARSVVFHRWGQTPLHFYGRIKTVCKIMTAATQRMSITTLERIEHWIMTLFSSKRARYLYDGMGEHMDHGRFPRELLEERTEVSFEGLLFPIPKNYDAYLRFSYGDNYTEWPRPGLRVSHHTAVKLQLDPENHSQSN